MLEACIRARLHSFIAGVSTLIWLGLFVYTLFRETTYSLYSSIDEADKIILAFGLAPVIYVFGVISDRVVDSIFDKYTNKKLKHKYFQKDDEYRIARSTIYLNSDSLINLFEYGRVRIRICRNWIFNGT